MSKGIRWMGTAWVITFASAIMVAAVTGNQGAGHVAVFAVGIPVVGFAYVKSGLYARDKENGNLYGLLATPKGCIAAGLLAGFAVALIAQRNLPSPGWWPLWSGIGICAFFWGIGLIHVLKRSVS